MLEARELVGLMMTVAIIVSVGDARPPQSIRGGQEAAIGEFPYQVSVRSSGQHICGGAVVNERFVVTAAHCVNDAKAPFTNLRIATATTWSFGGQTHAVQAVAFHAQYNTSTASSPHDIAMIKLKEPLQFSKNCNKIKLPEKEFEPDVEAVATGWGQESTGQKGGTIKLMKIKLKTISNEQCQKHVPYISLTPEHLCTYGGPGKGICQGDSGGPLVINDYLVGIVSFGIPCGRGYPDVYANVYQLLPWIKQKMATM